MANATKPTDVRVTKLSVYFLPVPLRTPLKFGHESLTEVTCCRVQLTVRDRKNNESEGWGETPLSAPWAWPADLSHQVRCDAMCQLVLEIAESWAGFDSFGHPIELTHSFVQNRLPRVLDDHNAARPAMRIPYLTALVCLSAIDIALHDAYGNVNGRDVYDTYSREFMNRDLSEYLAPADGSAADFRDKYPIDFLVDDPPTRLPVWHLVGGLDPITAEDADGNHQPHDDYPVLLSDWIKSDGLRCLKVKLRGDDAAWDYDRLVRVAQVALPLGVDRFSADFNCTVDEPAYVNTLLDRLHIEQPAIFTKLVYVEQPFPYELEKHTTDVRSIAQRKPIFLDESAHDWRYVKLGHSLGWSGVCLKTCKTQTGSLLSCCWAKAHGMPIMVADLTNPMLAQIPHVRLAAQVGTIHGVESNAMQFYPDASRPEAAIHPELYRRRDGVLDLRTIGGPGFGYRAREIERELPQPAGQFGD